jgi:hypothetical protein
MRIGIPVDWSSLRAALVGLVAGAALAAGIAWALWPAPEPRPATGQQQNLRTREIALTGPPVRTGKITVTPVAMRGGMIEVIGTHGEFFAHGRFCRVRIALTNADTYAHDLHTADQRLRTTDGKLVAPSRDAQGIMRQPDEVTVGRQVRIEYDLYFDIPVNAVADALVVRDAEDGAPATIPLPHHTWPDN